MNLGDRQRKLTFPRLGSDGKPNPVAQKMHNYWNAYGEPCFGANHFGSFGMLKVDTALQDLIYRNVIDLKPRRVDSITSALCKFSIFLRIFVIKLSKSARIYK